MQAGQIINNKYRIEKKLGSGGMSNVYLCTNLEMGTNWAIKEIYKTNGQKRLFITEENILKKLNHIYLPKIVDVFYTEEADYIVESYIEGVSLDTKLKQYGKFSESQIIEWSIQLCEALEYLHSIKPYPIIYRDMKPSNIIITSEGKAVIVDFGISREYKGNDCVDTFIAGTSTYAAPEQLIADGYTDCRTDIYSLGVTMYQSLSGKLPLYNTINLRSVDQSISKEIDEIVSKCLDKRMEYRYQTVEELKNVLKKLQEKNILKKIREKMKTYIILSTIGVLSIITYIMVFLGLKSL